MERFVTQYGAIEGVAAAEFYPDGSVRECILNRPNRLKTEYGDLVPQHQEDGVRRKYAKSLSFHANGNLKSISLQEQTLIPTALGVIPAELITFYPGGALHRVFPLNGKLSGYWTEANEYQLAPVLELDLPCGNFRKKIIGIRFYENGGVKSITLWPGDNVSLRTPVGDAEVRIGFALYPDGTMESFEPFRPLLVNTAIGAINAYHPGAVGIHSDNGSLRFDPMGKVCSLITATDRITVTGGDERQFVYQPGAKASPLHEERIEIVPLQIDFGGGNVRFNQNPDHEYRMDQYSFRVENRSLTDQSAGAECPGCDAGAE